MTQGRKIYQRVVMDMNQEGFPIVEEDSYWYTGHMALCAEGDDDDTGDDDAGDDDADDKDKKSDPNKEIIDSLKELKDGVKGNQEAVKQINDYIAQMQQSGDDDKKADKKKSSSDDDELPSNLELMDRKDFMNVIVNKISKMVEDQVKPVSEKTQNIEESTQVEKLKKERDELRQVHKDFDEWRDEMKGLFQQNPYLSMKQAYILAKSSNPDKAKKLEKKYAEDEDEDTKSKRFGGLTPTDKARKKSKGKELKGEEASELAWQTVMGDRNDIS